MSATTGLFEAPDLFPGGPGEAGFLFCPKTVRVRITVQNQGIWWQRGISPAGGGGIFWEPEEFLPAPFAGSLQDPCDAIRVRAAVPKASLPKGALQAAVSVATRTPEDLQE